MVVDGRFNCWFYKLIPQPGLPTDLAAVSAGVMLPWLDRGRRWSLVLSPGGEHRAGLGQAGEEGPVHALVSKRALKLSRRKHARDRGVGDEPYALTGEVIDHREDPEPPAAGEHIRHEVQRAALGYTLAGS